MVDAVRRDPECPVPAAPLPTPTRYGVAALLNERAVWWPQARWSTWAIATAPRALAGRRELGGQQAPSRALVGVSAVPVFMPKRNPEPVGNGGRTADGVAGLEIGDERVSCPGRRGTSFAEQGQFRLAAVSRPRFP